MTPDIGCHYTVVRVAHVNDIAFVGSAMVRALCERGIDARLVDPIRPGVRTPYPWKLATRPLRLAGLLAAGLELRGGRFDLLHVHYARLGVLGPLAGMPYVLHCHGSDIRGVAPASLWGREVAPFMRRAARVYYATPDLGPWVEAFRPDGSFLPNPIDTPPAEVLGRLPERDLLVGVRLSEVKGLPEILAILRAVVAARPGTTVTIVEQGDGVQAARDAARPDVRVVQPVAHARMPALFRVHRLVLGQQRVGALGNYELEAMAAAIPVAAAFRHADAYPSAPPIVDGTDPVDVAARIIRLLDDEPERLTLGRAGAEWVRRHHSPAVIVDRLIGDYAAILARDRR